MSFAYTAPEQRLNKIYTPPALAGWLYRLVKHTKPAWVLDPCVGSGNFLAPWFGSKPTVGIDTDDTILKTTLVPFNFAFLNQHFENTERNQLPDGQPLVVCNPPFNSHWQKKHYPEVFLRKILELFGKEVPIVFCCPMGTLLNQRRKSERYNWMRDEGPQITSVISCPIDLYPETQFHTMILLFNIKRVKPHYFLPSEVLSAPAV